MTAIATSAMIAMSFVRLIPFTNTSGFDKNIWMAAPMTGVNWVFAIFFPQIICHKRIYTRLVMSDVRRRGISTHLGYSDSSIAGLSMVLSGFIAFM
jgi:hypothetical protein